MVLFLVEGYFTPSFRNHGNEIFKGASIISWSCIRKKNKERKKKNLIEEDSPQNWILKLLLQWID